jgi:periplasmic protein TonB
MIRLLIYFMALAGPLQSVLGQVTNPPLDTNPVFEIYDLDTIARFPGDDVALSHFIFENIYAPPICSVVDLQGAVVVQFVVEKDGALSNYTIVRAGASCEQYHEVIFEVLNKMPCWIPAQRGGQAVRMRCMLPIRIRWE